MLHRIISLALIWLIGAQGVALAHPEGQGPAKVDTVKVGPYTLTLEYNTWPIRQGTSFELVIKPSGGMAGKQGWIRGTPRPELADEHFVDLRTYPGIDDGWVLQDVAGPVGPRLWEFRISGPAGEATGRYTGYQVAEPPFLPMWAGWLIGLVPLYGLIWFGFREFRRVRRLIAADGGARAA